MKIIALAGMGKSGKTTAAIAMAKALFDEGYTPILEHFAGPLKDASHSLGFVKDGEYDHLYRKFCQFVGETAREESPEWWVNLMAERLDDIADQEASTIGSDNWHERVVLIDDIRYENELALVKKYSGKIVFVSAQSRLKDLDAEWRQHHSERLARLYENGEFEDELFDTTVSNNSDNDVDSFKAVVSSLAVQMVNTVGEC